MAEGDDRQREDLSEEASPHKVQELRQKGQVAQSRELSGLFALLATGMALYVSAPSFGQQIIDYMREIFSLDYSSRNDLGSKKLMMTQFLQAAKMIALLGLPIAIAGFILGVLGSFAQVGSIFSSEPLSPDLERINPIRGFQRLFSMKQVYDSIRLVIRGVIVAVVAYFLVKSQIIFAPSYTLSEPASLLGVYGSSSRIIFMGLFAVLTIFAGFDFWLQKWEFGKNVRLTRQEQKEELKEHEGDPLIKARIRSIQKEMARKRMMEAVKKADVVVTNPTHIAVALSYNKDEMNAPKVIAMGADFLAQKIKSIARENDIPLIENKPLARTLFKTVKVGQYIPKALYQAVAEVLAFVYRLKNKKVVD